MVKSENQRARTLHMHKGTYLRNKRQREKMSSTTDAEKKEKQEHREVANRIVSSGAVYLVEQAGTTLREKKVQGKGTGEKKKFTKTCSLCHVEKSN